MGAATGKTLLRRLIFESSIDGFAEFLLDKGKKPEAETSYLRALNYLDKKVAVRPDYFFKASRYFTKQKQYEEALNILSKGTEYLPDNVKIRIALASLYERIGILYRAREEYKSALILDPTNRLAKAKVKKLTGS